MTLLLAIAAIWCSAWLIGLALLYAGYKAKWRRQDAYMQEMFKEMENPTRINWPDSWK
jgi:hypothetical protein